MILLRVYGYVAVIYQIDKIVAYHSIRIAGLRNQVRKGFREDQFPKNFAL